MGGFLTMGLFGIIIASVVNMFIGSSGMSMIQETHICMNRLLERFVIFFIVNA